MEDRKPALREIVDRFSEAFPKMDDAMRRIALSSYRRLALGVPALPEEIAADAKRPVDEVSRILGDWVGWAFRTGPGVRRSDSAGQIPGRVKRNYIRRHDCAAGGVVVEHGSEAIGGFRFVLELRAVR
jgi:hypothetical protein